jgi:uncharacterized protein YbjT (DUF2867 family)
MEDVMTSQKVDPAKPTLILGGSGKTGRRIADRLTARGRPVRLGSRSTVPAFDWNDRSAWPAALEGVRAIYISYYPDLAVPGAEAAVGTLVDLALEMGIRRLVLLSGRGESEAQAAEQRLIASGADWTILRCSWFNQNFSEGAFLDQVLSGEIALPAGAVGEPFADADDIADAAVAALTDDRHIGELYELTGPRLLTFAGAAAEISAATGREIRYVEIAHDDLAAALADEPDDVAWLVGYLFKEVLDGRNASLTDGIERALGRRPRDFSDYARQAAASGVWEVSK